MRITLEYRNPSSTHCEVIVFVNGALTGTLVLRQSELGSFEQILSGGCAKGIDEFLSRGNPTPPGER